MACKVSSCASIDELTLHWHWWWNQKVKRDARGQPVTKRLFISIRGTPLSYRTVESQIRRDCERLGINAPEAPPLRRVTHHCLRHYFSDTLTDNGCPTYWWKVLRGESLKGTTQGAYNHIKDDKLREVYMKHRPRFTIIQPASYPVYGGKQDRGRSLLQAGDETVAASALVAAGGAAKALA